MIKKLMIAMALVLALGSAAQAQTAVADTAAVADDGTPVLLPTEFFGNTLNVTGKALTRANLARRGLKVYDQLVADSYVVLNVSQDGFNYTLAMLEFDENADSTFNRISFLKYDLKRDQAVELEKNIQATLEDKYTVISQTTNDMPSCFVNINGITCELMIMHNVTEEMARKLKPETDNNYCLSLSYTVGDPVLQEPQQQQQ